MKKSLFIAVGLWMLLCLGMSLWAITPAHSQGMRGDAPAGHVRGDAYVPDTAYALPAPSVKPMPAPQGNHSRSGGGQAYQQHNDQYHARRQAQNLQHAPYRPWEKDYHYQQELSMLVRESALRQRQLRQRADADLSRLEAQRIENANRHLSSLERLGDRKNSSYTEYSTLASRQNATAADFRARSGQIKMNLESAQLREQNDLNRRIKALDDRFARHEPYLTLLQGR